ncbi:MAG: LrgB family protein [Clostridia bacterium]|nr:LrgB family protein [Clostridia bacterium]
MEILNAIYENPLFGIIVSLLAYEAAVWIYNKSNKFVLLNPLLVSVAMVIGFLLIFDIPYDTYNIGGKFLTMFISPVTVVLAVPLYLQIKSLKDNAGIILFSIFIGAVASVVGICVYQKLFPMETAVFASLVPKSITTAIAVEVSEQFGGIPGITVIAVAFTGLLGAIFSPIMAKVFGVKNDIAKGLAIGTSSHVLGTTKAVEMGEQVGAMSSLSIAIAGVVTVFTAPFIVRLFGLL